MPSVRGRRAGRLVAAGVLVGLLAFGALRTVGGSGEVEVRTNPPGLEVAAPPVPGPTGGVPEVASGPETTTSSSATASSTAGAPGTTRPQPKERKPKPAPLIQTTSSTTTTTAAVGTVPTDPPLISGSVDDATFGADGLVLEAFGPGGDRPVGMVLQPDGKVVVVGIDDDGSATQEGIVGVILRLNADGSRDTTFGAGGTVRFAGQPVAVALAPDGRIVVFGIIAPPTQEWGHTTGGVLRVLPDGRVDVGFGHDGIAPVPTDGLGGAVALQPDGRIVVASQSGFVLHPERAGIPGNGAIGMGVTRLTPTGALDTSFGTDGLTRIPMSDPERFTEVSSAVAVLDDASIAVVGQSNPYGPTASAFSPGDTVVARLRPDGRLDAGFNGSGVKRIDFGGSDGGSAVLADTHGRVVVAATSPENMAPPHPGYLARLLPTGDLDPTFAGGGVTPTGAQIAALTRDRKGRILAAARTSSESYLFRFSPDGASDAPGYRWTGRFGAVGPAPVGVAVQPDGTIVYAGSTINNAGPANKPYDGDWFIRRMTPTL